MKKHKNSVGVSSRTPYKHWLYRSMLGKMVGAAATGKTPCGDTIKVIDLCAGDGAQTGDDPMSSSPAIADRHMTSKFPMSHRLRNRTAYLFERETTTFARLQERFGGRSHMVLHHTDSKGITLRDINAQRGQGVFVYADPNSISTLPVTEDLIGSFTDTTLFLMTLGCNVAGVKRIAVEERIGWMDIVNMAVKRRNRLHDVMLLTLNRDDSQWAYLAAFPLRWAKEFQADSVRVGQKLWTNGVTAHSITHDRRQFESKMEELFYTAKERQNMNQSNLI